MRATALLESQHREICTLIDELEKPGVDRKGLSERLATALIAHMVIEEEIFYPQTEKLLREVVQQGSEDHETEIPAIERLLATPADDERFWARLRVLKVLIQLHVNKEEGILFPTVNRSFTTEKNAQLGQVMKARFDQVVKAGHFGALKLRMAEAVKRAPGGIVALAVIGQAVKRERARQGREEHEGASCSLEDRHSQPGSEKGQGGHGGGQESKD